LILDSITFIFEYFEYPTFVLFIIYYKIDLINSILII
jgi:hypothetical protein